MFTSHLGAPRGVGVAPGEIVNADEDNSTHTAAPIDSHASFVFLEQAADLARVVTAFVLFVPNWSLSFQLSLQLLDILESGVIATIP